MKQILVMMAVVMGQSVLAADKPLTREESARVIEAAIRNSANKPTGELTRADYEKVKVLRLIGKQLTDLRALRNSHS